MLASLTHFNTRKSLMQPWIAWCLVAAATMTCVSITIGWRLGVSDVRGSSPRPPAARNVLFTLALIALDPLQRTVTLDWWIIGDDCTDGADASSICPVVNIFVNPTQFLNTGSRPTPPSDSSAAVQPAFQHDATAFALNGRVAQPAFRTQLDIRPRPSSARVDLVDYPFDHYSAYASIFARTNDTGEAVGAWIFNLTGTAFGFDAELDSIEVDANAVTSVNILVDRALSVKLYVITIVVGMWLISLSLMMATIKAAIFRHKIETAVLVLPVATMIAFAQLRASMPNAPAGFGTNIDVIGSLPTYVCLVFTMVGSLVYCLAGSPVRQSKQQGDQDCCISVLENGNGIGAVQR
ncbi:hypothetical protein BC826DRAFT_43268 [Russula brevipes]|nr:hypothetical protein BC826DRAFT_43268 [Russula brevipes]